MSTPRGLVTDAAEVPVVRGELLLPPVPQSAGAARRLLQQVLDDAGRTDALDAAELACTELVTNAVLHAHTPFRVTIAAGAQVVVEVHDFSVSLPSRRDYDTQATTGRGLALVAALADSHGVRTGPGGKTVWFALGGPQAERGEEQLDGWSDGEWPGWQTGPLAPPVEASPHTRTVRLLNLPPTLWLAARQHHDALLRELVLYGAHHGGLGVDVVATDRARTAVATAVGAALADAHREGTARPAVPLGHPSPLPWVPAPLDLELEVPVDLGPSFSAMQDTLDVAEHLAQQGLLLTRPGLPEVIAMRDWQCEQVVAQLAGVAPAPWAGADQQRFVDRPDERVAATDDAHLAVFRDSPRGVVAADDSNRIIAVSRSLARLTGWEVDDLVGRRVVALIPPRLREAHVAGFTRHLTTGEAHVLGVPLTLPVQHAAGTEVVCTFMVEQGPSIAGRPTYLAWIEAVGNASR